MGCLDRIFFITLQLIMRKLLTIAIALLVAFVAEAHSLRGERHHSCEVKNHFQEQLECCHRHNIDAERTSTLVVPSRTTTTSLSRQNHHRTTQYSVVERCVAIANYPIRLLSRRFGGHLCGVESCIYMFCQLRL